MYSLSFCKKAIGLFSLIGTFSVTSITNVSAMHRADDPGVTERAIEFSKTLPYATGWLLAKDSNAGSVIFLNETTAITTAHSFVGREKMAHIVVAADQIQMLFHPQTLQFSWDMTLNQIKNSGTPWTSVKNQISLATFSLYQSVGVDITHCTPSYFLDLLKQWENPSKTLEKSKSGVKLSGKEYNMKGPDFSIIKFHKPIKLDKEPFRLQEYNFDDLADYTPYSFGYPGANGTSDKKNHGIGEINDSHATSYLSLSCFRAHNIALSEDKSFFYSKLYSLGGMDDSYLCDGLPSPQTVPFIGLMAGGMSGGPLVFINSKGDYILGGLNSSVQSKKVKEMLDILTPHIDDLKNDLEPDLHSAIDLWKEEVHKFYNIPFPIYNMFQAFTPEIIAEIKKIMEK